MVFYYIYSLELILKKSVIICNFSMQFFHLKTKSLF